MILYVQSHDDTDRDFFKIMEPEDLTPIYAKYPMTQEIAMSCDTLDEAVRAIAEYLDGHSTHAWVEDKDLSKSLRQKAAAVGLALATAAPSVMMLPSPKATPSLHATAQEQAPRKDLFGTHPNDRFLWNIQQIESSGGSNINHKPIASGKFKGAKAVGQWGLLKPTINDMISRARNSGTLTPEMEKLEGMSRDQLEDHFKKNPQIELDLARQLATHVIKRQGGDIHRAAYSWLHGHNLTPHDINDSRLSSSNYVNRFRAVDRLNPFAKKAPTALNKMMQEIGSEDFRMRVKNWYKRREDEIIDEPMRSSNFQPDPGRIRDRELDEVKPDSMKTSMERLTANTKFANKRNS